MITPTDIITFYYLTYLYQTEPARFKTEYADFVFRDTLLDLKRKYLDTFIPLVRAQLFK